LIALPEHPHTGPRHFLASVIACLLLAVLPAAAAARPARATSAANATPYVAVKGNHLVNAAGQTIRLLGVDRSGSEYMCTGGWGIFDGPVDGAAVQAMAAWHIDAVRVPLNEDCWLAINGVKPSLSGAAYQGAIEEYVRMLQSSGLVVILDLHWAAPGAHRAESQWPMADADHAPAFWASVAKAFASNHGVAFDLFNEPYITSWSCWLSGCGASYKDGQTTVTYQTAGMQSLVTAVRSAGATQPVLLGGLQWAGDESQWLSHEPADPAHQLAVSFHNYNFIGCDTEACWNTTIAPLARQVPVVTGELGQSGCRAGYVDKYMPWADAHGISYLGWTWDAVSASWTCSGGPALIKNYEGVPTTYGTGLEHHLAELAAAP
jgi:hypothetical protein